MFYILTNEIFDCMQEKHKLIYEYFDKHGIEGKYLAKITLSFNLENDDISQSDSIEFIPNLDKFFLSRGQADQIILDYIFDTTSYDIKSIKNLHRIPSIDGLPFLLLLNESDSNSMKFFLASRRIPGSVTIRGKHKIDSLGNIEEIYGDLAFIGSSTCNLGNLKIITGNFWIAQFHPFTNINDLDNLEFVGKDLYLKNSPIKDLKNLKRVGGTLNLRKTKIESLGSLNHVGNNIFLPKELKGSFDLSNIYIGGKVKYFSN